MTPSAFDTPPRPPAEPPREHLLRLCVSGTPPVRRFFGDMSQTERIPRRLGSTDAGGVG